MPINAPIEYYRLQELYSKEKDPAEKEKILKEMFKILPKHKGTDREFASLKRRMSLLKKSMSKSHQLHHAVSIRKHWPRVCLVGYDRDFINKNFKLTSVEGIQYGIAVVNDMHVQIVALQNVERYKDILTQSEIVMSREKLPITNFQMVSDNPNIQKALEDYGIIRVYTENSKDAMSFMKGDSIIDLAKKLKLNARKDSYAVVYGSNVKFQGQPVSMRYKLNDGDRVFIKI